MSDPFVGEVRLVGFNFAPLNWSQCNGATIAISENDTLFSLIGTTYGGDGQNTFNLPNLQGRTPVHQGTSNLGSSYVIGEVAGVESVTLTSGTYPNHSHSLLASGNQGGANSPGSNVLGQVSSAYSNQTPSNAALMNGAVLGNSAGGSQPHDNLQPYLVLTWVIALFGIYPSRN